MKMIGGALTLTLLIVTSFLPCNTIGLTLKFEIVWVLWHPKSIQIDGCPIHGLEYILIYVQYVASNRYVYLQHALVLLPQSHTNVQPSSMFDFKPGGVGGGGAGGDPLGGGGGLGASSAAAAAAAAAAAMYHSQLGQLPLSGGHELLQEYPGL